MRVFVHNEYAAYSSKWTNVGNYGLENPFLSYLDKAPLGSYSVCMRPDGGEESQVGAVAHLIISEGVS